MSMDKAIKQGKEHRKPYTGSKAIARSCRNHGGCDWCRGNRMYKNIKRLQHMEAQMKEETDETERRTE